jgi:predicted nucleic acid-binding protein
VGGLTLDSGALIAFERNDRRMMAHLKEAARRDADLTVPSAVVAEVWRGGPRSARVALLLDACSVQPLTDACARSAGEALAAVRGSGTIDAIVMASAAQRGDAVLASDEEDLQRLARHFARVRVIPL